MARKYAEKDIKLLWGNSARMCAFPDCRRLLTEEANKADDAVTLGEMAHIEAHSDNGPRANPNLPHVKRDVYENLILLCAHHHKLVDRQPNSYTADDLRQWKAKHEAWVVQRLTEEMPRVTFVELEIITEALLQTPTEPTNNFTHIDPTQKMKRNNLTSEVSDLITLGMFKFVEVQKYIQKQSVLNNNAFPERLKVGFLKEYYSLRQDGLEGDALFEGLLDFTTQGSSDFRKRAAGLAVLVYYFHTCEVFEQ